MSLSSDTNEDRLEAIHRNYDTAQNVKWRFDLYGPDFAQPYVNIDMAIAESLQLTGNETVIDRGASCGRFLRLLREDMHHEGLLVGVEVNMGQLYADQNMLDWLADKKVAGDTVFVQGRAEHPPIAKGSADAVVDEMMLYHLSKKAQEQAIEAAKISLKPDGLYVVGTSEACNKLRHRNLEAIKARELTKNPPLQMLEGHDGLTPFEVFPPAFMNEGFDTTRARAVLPQHFRYAYHFTQRSKMVIDTEDKVEAYMRSQRSLNNQFEPPITKELEATPEVTAADNFIRDRIVQEIRLRGQFQDYIYRDFIVCSNNPQPALAARPNFTDISLVT